MAFSEDSMEYRPEKTLRELQAEVHQTARSKGWYDTDQARTFGDLIALVHSEASEALEAYRDTGDPSKWWFNRTRRFDLKPEGVPTELADIVIRVLDMCALYGIDLQEVIEVKNEYNKTRPYLHGGRVM